MNGVTRILSTIEEGDEQPYGKVRPPVVYDELRQSAGQEPWECI
jgi:hypothetical protein